MIPREQQVELVLHEVLTRRATGELVSNAEVAAQHSELQPELERALAFATRLEEGRLRAPQPAFRGHRRPSFRDPMNDEALEAPIRLSLNLEETDDAEDLLPFVPGYAIERQIGRGGQAIVYLARQHSTGQAVAIKVLTVGRSTSARARFDREATILAAMDHPGVVGIVDRGCTEDGSWFIVMPYIDGPRLDDYLSKIAKSLHATVVVRLFAQVARAVGAAHSRGVVHRDLKPSNVRVDQYGIPHVLDFGLARLLESTPGSMICNGDFTLTAERQVIGSLPFLSPEQWRGDKTLDARTDVYAIGVMLYEALAGESPYRRPMSEADLEANICRRVAPRASSRAGARQGVDRRIDAILKRSLAKVAAERYPDASPLAAELEAFAAGTLRKSLPSRQIRRCVISGAAGAIIVAALAAWTVCARSAPIHRGADLNVAQPSLPQMVNSIGVRMATIPAGSFFMGSPVSQPGHCAAESRHLVRIDRPYWLGLTELTRRQYQLVMGSTTGDPSASDLPVYRVSWFDAQEFCRRLSSREHLHYRLPSEAEWEYAANAHGSGGFDPDSKSLSAVAWFDANAGSRLHAVAQLRPNAWGMFDMLGGVSEWCDDVRGKENQFAVFKGGSYLDPMIRCRTAATFSAQKSDLADDRGFRLAADLNP